MRAFLDPIAEWLQRWLTKGGDPVGQGFALGGSGIQVKEVDLDAGDSPSNAVAEIRSRSGNALEERSWLVAEAHWAQDVDPPAFPTLAAWMLLLTPYLVLELFLNVLVRSWRRLPSRRLGPWFGFLLACIGVAAAPLVALALGALILVLLLSQLIPVPWIRRFTKKVGVALSASLGDSYVLTSSPTQFGGMVGTALRSMRWVAARAKRVVVVAHSQGAAVAHAALQRDPAPDVALFVSHGSGLKRLHVLTALRTRKVLLFLITVPCFVGIPLLATAGPKTFLGFVLVEKGVPRWASVLTLVGLALVAITFWLTVKLRGRFSQDSLWLTSRPGLTWVDYYATSDLVPDGPIVQSGEGGPGRPTSIEVANFASLFRDHTGYFQNRDQFMPDLVHRLALATEPPLDISRPAEGGEDVLDAAWWRRTRRVAARAIFRLAVIPLAVGLVLAYGGPIADSPVLDPAATALNTVVGQVVELPAPLAPFRGLPEGTLATLGWMLLVGAALLAVGAVAWRVWDGVAVGKFLGDGAPPRGTPSRGRPIGGAVISPSRWPDHTGFVVSGLAASMLFAGLVGWTPRLEGWIWGPVLFAGFYALTVAVGMTVIGPQPGRRALRWVAAVTSLVSLIGLFQMCSYLYGS